MDHHREPTTIAELVKKPMPLGSQNETLLRRQPIERAIIDLA
jgi:hypothetical protein